MIMKTFLIIFVLSALLSCNSTKKKDAAKTETTGRGKLSKN
jgi:hypothetical protein